jgi:hypothetical protein
MVSKTVMAQALQSQEITGGTDIHKSLNSLVPRDKLIEGAKFIMSFESSSNFQFEP